MVAGLLPFVKNRVSIAAIVLIVQVFLFVNADFIYGADAARIRVEFSIYFFLLLIAFATIAKPLPTASTGNRSGVGKEQAMNFASMFIITAVVLTGLTALGAFILFKKASLDLALAIGGYFFLHGFVKSYIEEQVFRYALPVYMGLGDILSSLLFSLFHVGFAFSLAAANSLGFLDLALLFGLWFGLGIAWSFVRKSFGTIGSTGSHFAYNLWVFLGGKLI